MGCGNKQEAPLGSASGAASVAGVGSVPAAASQVAPPAYVGIPRSGDEVHAQINKSRRAPYEGKVGTLTGRVTIKGDAPPATEWSFPPDCSQASATYGRAFRVGQDNALADALVTVTGYDAFVPPKGPAVSLKITGCAAEKRTVAMTFGQRLEVANIDLKGSYMPILDPAPYRAMMIAMPGGEPIKLYPYQPGINYVLRDLQGKEFLQADVFVLKFATLDVTGLDGRYTIDRIPVGKVKVSALLPVIDKIVEKADVEIVEGENKLDLELSFDAKADKIVVRPASPWARTSSSAAPSSGAFGLPPAPKNVPH